MRLRLETVLISRRRFNLCASSVCWRAVTQRLSLQQSFCVPRYPESSICVCTNCLQVFLFFLSSYFSARELIKPFFRTNKVDLKQRGRTSDDLPTTTARHHVSAIGAIRVLYLRSLDLGYSFSHAKTFLTGKRMLVSVWERRVFLLNCFDFSGTPYQQPPQVTLPSQVGTSSIAPFVAPNLTHHRSQHSYPLAHAIPTGGGCLIYSIMGHLSAVARLPDTTSSTLDMLG